MKLACVATAALASASVAAASPVKSSRAERLASATSMSCGSGVSLCGLLTLESGDGSGYYAHEAVSVHGLWPEVSPYGDSECIAPSLSSADPTILYPCYAALDDDTDETNAAHQLEFEQHEWQAHGICAGVTDAADFFEQVCALSTAPLAVMAPIKAAGGDLAAMETALTAAGYEVYALDKDNAQLELSACATPDGVWTLAAQADFPTACGGWPDTADDDDGGAASGDDDDAVASCEPNTHGPACTADTNCTGVADCVRCASSGYCTDVPLAAVRAPGPRAVAA